MLRVACRPLRLPWLLQDREGHRTRPYWITDIAGRHVANLNDETPPCNDANRLEKIGCIVSKHGDDWMTEGDSLARISISLLVASDFQRIQNPATEANQSR